MNDNMNYSEYNDGRRPIPWNKLFLSLAGIALVIVLVLLFLKFCSKGSLADALLKGGKDYYAKHPSSLPQQVGECYQVSLEELKSDNLVQTKKFNDCDNQDSYVNVCYMESKNYHYSVNLTCDSEKTSYGLWNDGKESDLLDTSDVRFKFLGQTLNKGTKTYYPKNETDASKVNNYYVTSPDSGYQEKEDEQTGYKWYTNQDTRIYWNSGAYSSTQPTYFYTKGESKTVTKASLTKPNEASYRTIEEKTLTRYKKVSYQFKWDCTSNDPNVPGTVLGSKIPCLMREDSMKEVKNYYYTCDGVNEVAMNTVCADYTEWSADACKTTSSIKCESQAGYVYTDTMWKWYNNATLKVYYPSGSSDVNKENTYYVDAPITGAIKDETTKATVYKFYKLEENNETGNVEEWKDITNDYVTLKELIQSFNSAGYDVSNLDDINKIDNIRYQLKLQYRNLNK